MVLGKLECAKLYNKLSNNVYINLTLKRQEMFKRASSTNVIWEMQSRIFELTNSDKTI